MFRLRMTTIVLLGLLVGSAAAQGNVNTGNEFLQVCAENDKIGAGSAHTGNEYQGGFCLGYIAGFAVADQATCYPNGATNMQGVLVVEKFLRDHPDRLQEDRSTLVRAALRQAWPCSEKSK